MMNLSFTHGLLILLIGVEQVSSFCNMQMAQVEIDSKRTPDGDVILTSRYICRYKTIKFTEKRRQFPEDCMWCSCDGPFFSCCSYGTVESTDSTECEVIKDGCNRKAVLKTDHSKPCPSVSAVLG